MDDPVWVRRARGFLDFFSTLNLSILLNHRCWKGSKEEKRKLDKGHLKVIRDKFWEIRLLVRWKKRFQVSVHSCNTDGDAVKQQVDVEILLEVMLMLRSWCRGGRSRHQLSVFLCDYSDSSWILKLFQCIHCSAEIRQLWSEAAAVCVGKQR